MLNLAIYLLSVIIILKTEGIFMSFEFVRVTANSRRLSYLETNLSNKYGGEANYTYEDGEELDFSCSSWYWLLKKSDTLRLEYYNANDILLLRTQPQPQPRLKFRSVLTSNNNKYYLDCVLRKEDTEKQHRRRIKEYRYRTTFYLNERNLDAVTVDHAMILSVNDQDLRVNNIGPNYDDYEFRYIDGEILHVTCRKTNNYMGGSLTFTYDVNIDESTHFQRITINRTSSEISINALSPNILKERLLSCSINNSDVPKPNARLQFVSDLPENDVRIRGLPRDNILYQYTNDISQWTIEYQYAVNETIYLICVAKGRLGNTHQLLGWEFNGSKSVFNATSLLNTAALVTEQAFTKTLGAADNAKKIRCKYFENTFSKTVEVILRLKPEETMDAIRSDNIITILSCSVGAVLVILGMAGVGGWCILRTRSGNNKRNTKTSYVDLTNGNDIIKPQNDECENQYDSCYADADNISDIYCEIPADKDIDPADQYEEINISRCKPEIDERKTRNSLIYDEPYVHFRMRGTMNTLHGV